MNWNKGLGKPDLFIIGNDGEITANPKYKDSMVVYENYSLDSFEKAIKGLIQDK